MSTPSNLLAPFLIVIGLLESRVNGLVSDARLVEGPSALEGNVEVLISGIPISGTAGGTWYRVCGPNLGAWDAIAVCRHLNFAGLNRVFETSPYPSSTSGPANPGGATPFQAWQMIQCDPDEGLSSCTHAPVFPCPSGDGAVKCFGNEYLGCFQDVTGDRLFDGDSHNEAGMTIEKCIDYCDQSTAGDFVYAGVEFGTECYCGNDTDYEKVDNPNYGRVGDDFCQTKCGGSTMESCGGAGYLAIFQIHKLETTTTQPMMTSTPSENVDGERPEPTSFDPVMPDDVEPNNGTEANIGLYAGSGAAGALVVLLIVLGIVAVLFVIRKRKSLKSNGASSREIPPKIPVYEDTDNRYDENFYHDVNYAEMTDLHSEQPPPEYEVAGLYNKALDVKETGTNGNLESISTYARISKEHGSSNHHQSETELGRQPGRQGLPESQNETLSVDDDISVLYAKPDKGRELWVECELYVMGEETAPRQEPDGAIQNTELGTNLETGLVERRKDSQENCRFVEIADDGLYAMSNPDIEN